MRATFSKVDILPSYPALTCCLRLQCLHSLHMDLSKILVFSLKLRAIDTRSREPEHTRDTQGGKLRCPMPLSVASVPVVRVRCHGSLYSLELRL